MIFHVIRMFIDFGSVLAPILASFWKVLEALGRLGGYLGSTLDPSWLIFLVLVLAMKFE